MVFNVVHFRAVNYYADLLIKPTAVQLRLCTPRHVSVVTIRPPSGRMFFLTKQRMVH
jgi:hypothetical protein